MSLHFHSTFGVTTSMLIRQDKRALSLVNVSSQLHSCDCHLKTQKIISLVGLVASNLENEINIVRSLQFEKQDEQSVKCSHVEIRLTHDEFDTIFIARYLIKTNIHARIVRIDRSDL